MHPSRPIVQTDVTRNVTRNVTRRELSRSNPSRRTSPSGLQRHPESGSARKWTCLTSVETAHVPPSTFGEGVTTDRMRCTVCCIRYVVPLR